MEVLNVVKIKNPEFVSSIKDRGESFANVLNNTSFKDNANLNSSISSAQNEIPNTIDSANNTSKSIGIVQNQGADNKAFNNLHTRSKEAHLEDEIALGEISNVINTSDIIHLNIGELGVQVIEKLKGFESHAEDLNKYMVDQKTLFISYGGNFEGGVDFDVKVKDLNHLTSSSAQENLYAALNSGILINDFGMQKNTSEMQYDEKIYSDSGLKGWLVDDIRFMEFADRIDESSLDNSINTTQNSNMITMDYPIHPENNALESEITQQTNVVASNSMNELVGRTHVKIGLQGNENGLSTLLSEEGGAYSNQENEKIVHMGQSNYIKHSGIGVSSSDVNIKQTALNSSFNNAVNRDSQTGTGVINNELGADSTQHISGFAKSVQPDVDVLTDSDRFITLHTSTRSMAHDISGVVKSQIIKTVDGKFEIILEPKHLGKMHVAISTNSENVKLITLRMENLSAMQEVQARLASMVDSVSESKLGNVKIEFVMGDVDEFISDSRLRDSLDAGLHNDLNDRQNTGSDMHGQKDFFIAKSNDVDHDNIGNTEVVNSMGNKNITTGIWKDMNTGRVAVNIIV